MSEPIRPRLGLPTEDEVCARRDQGLHPVVLWLPPLGSGEFAEEASRQAHVLLKAAEDERQVLAWVNSHADDLIDMIGEEESRHASQGT